MRKAHKFQIFLASSMVLAAGVGAHGQPRAVRATRLRAAPTATPQSTTTAAGSQASLSGFAAAYSPAPAPEKAAALPDYGVETAKRVARILGGPGRSLRPPLESFSPRDLARVLYVLEREAGDFAKAFRGTLQRS